MMQINTNVLVIGSGIAGALCAYELSRHGVKVALVEAGSSLTRSHIVDAFTSSPDFDLSSGFPNDAHAPRPDNRNNNDHYLQYTPQTTHRRLDYLSAVGGTTWHWGGMAVRLTENDFEMRDRYGIGENWPLSYRTLETFYAEAEKEIGVAGDDRANYGAPRSTTFPMPPFPPSYGEKKLADLLQPLGLRFISAPVARNSITYDGRNQCQGFGTCSPICPSGAQYNASVHVEKAVAHGCHLFADTRVNQLVTDEKGVVTHAIAINAKGETITFHATIVVMAANAIETPKLLLMSANQQHSTGLANRSGNVGRYLFGHPGLSCAMRLPTPHGLGRGPVHTLACFTHREGDFRKQHAAHTITIANHLPLYALHDAAIGGIERSRTLPPQLDQHIKAEMLNTVYFNFMLDQLPQKQNGITLDTTKKDSGGQPGILINWEMSEYETRGAEHAKGIAQKIGAHLQANKITFEFPVQHHHPMGTTRMGSVPETSVVDANCKTHDHPNLYIVGSSVFPAGGTANPTLTIAALSLRTADIIRKRMRS